MKKALKIIKSIFSVFCTFFFVFSLVLMISTIVTSSSGKPASIGNYYAFVVESDSMTGTLEVNDIFIASKNIDKLEENQIVVYRSKSGTMKGKLITHRIVEIKIENDEYIYYCRGDKKGAVIDKGITRDDIIAVYVKKIDWLSGIYRVLTNGYGFFFIIICPIGAIFVYEVIRLIKNSKVNNDKELLKEEESKRLIEDYKKQILEDLKKNTKK